MRNLVKQFRKDWANDSGLAEICTRVYAHLSDASNRLEHFSYFQLARAAKSNDDARVSKALQYLSSPRCRVLSQIFLYIEGDQTWEFDSSDMAEFFHEGKFAHPRTGQEMDLNEISVAFTTGVHFLEAEQN